MLHENTALLEHGFTSRKLSFCFTHPVAEENKKKFSFERSELENKTVLFTLLLQNIVE